MPQGGAASCWQLVEWQTAPGTHVDRGGHTATAIGHNIIIAGGRRGSLFFKDVLVFDTKAGKLSKPVTEFPRPLKPRANHTATLIGNRIWFIGGGDKDWVFNDVFTLDVSTWAWQCIKVNDPHELLARTAHAAEVHPHLPSVILITGGFGPVAPGCEEDMLNDIVLFDTQSCSTEQLVPPNSCVPRRAYHTMNIIDDKIYLFGGRRHKGAYDAEGNKLSEVLDGTEVLWVFDMAGNSWLPPPAVTGTPPSPRSSHRSVAVNNRIIVYGGAAAGGAEAPAERLTDVHTLLVRPHNQLVWSNCDHPQPSNNMPQGRNAHTLSLVNDTLYVICGYNGSSLTEGKKKYAKDCWALKLSPGAGAGLGAPAVAAATASALPAMSAQPADTGQGAPSHKRRTPPARRATAGEAGEGAAAAAGGPGPAVAGPAAGAAAWRTVKRQRSGGKDAQHPPQQQEQQQQQQQQQPAWQQQQQMWQQPHSELQQARYQQMLQQQQQQYLGRPGTEREQSLTAAMAAAVLDQVQVMCNAPGRAGSPLRPGSPLRENFSAGSLYLQQEVEHLREQLQQNIKWGSSLEAEVRLLKQQQSEAKAEARQDKQLAEHKLQDQQMEAARHKTLAEQALVRQQRAQEEATIAQQDLSTAKQQLQKAELERHAAQQQVQALNGEVRKLRARSTEADQELRQVQLQVQQQQQERRLQEQLTRERQLQQEEAAVTRASIEQHRSELRRLNDTMAEQKQKYDATLLQHQQEAATHQQQLLETRSHVQELQTQLDGAVATATDAKKQRDEAMQMQLTTREQLNTLKTTHKAMLAEKAHLDTELTKLRDEKELLGKVLEQRRSAGVTMQAALQQLQAAMQTVMGASGQLTR